MIETTEVRLPSYFIPKKNVKWEGKGIRKATAWYNSHLAVNRPPIRGRPAPIVPTVVLMTEDAANRHKAEKGGIFSISGKFCLGLPLSEVIDYLKSA
jgi:hypothetical protein